MSPFEHREVFVLDDGGEVDLDLGNYERFLDIKLTQDNNITTGKIYQYVINKERRGDSLGKTVQVVPHITDAIEEWIERVAMKPVNGMEGLADVCVIELGDTIGIRDHINSKSMCVCGSMKMLADDLLPNKTIRETISRILGSTTRSAFSRSSVHVQDMESACSPQPKVLLPTVSAATKEECATPLCENDTSIMQESRKEGKTDLNMLELSSKKSWATKNVSRSEVMIESVSVREATSQPIAPQAKEEVQQKLLVGEKGHLQWKTSEAFVAENLLVLQPATHFWEACRWECMEI